LPPLKERKDDIVSLADRIRRRMNARFHCDVEGFEEDVLDTFLRYDWPGNVRELSNVIKATYIERASRRIAVADLPQQVRERLMAMEKVPQNECQRLLAALVAPNENMSKAAAQKLQRWPAIKPARPQVVLGEWTRSSLLAPAVRVMGEALFLAKMRPVQSGEAFRIISPPLHSLVRRELAEAIENVFETFARTYGATQERPLEIRVVRGLHGGSVGLGEGRALDILAAGGKALRAWCRPRDAVNERVAQKSKG
jgi:hypothetical protein